MARERPRKDSPDDRARLKEVHTTETTESKVNEDFIVWLKTKGPTWALVFLVAVIAYLAMVQWRTKKANTRNEAWRAVADLQTGSKPVEWEDIAIDHGATDGIGILARLRAADMYLMSVQMNSDIDAQSAFSTVATPLTDEKRLTNLNEADRLFGKVIALDDGTEAMTITTVNALFGRAAVAESKHDAAAAKGFYMDAKERAGANFTRLQDIATQRHDIVDDICRDVTLIAEAPVPAIDPLRPVTLDPSVRAIIEGDAPRTDG
ncbi:MAG: hypothetical protein AAF432_16035 [Planctomycetota bacterium]